MQMNTYNDGFLYKERNIFIYSICKPKESPNSVLLTTFITFLLTPQLTKFSDFLLESKDFQGIKEVAKFGYSLMHFLNLTILCKWLKFTQNPAFNSKIIRSIATSQS